MLCKRGNLVIKGSRVMAITGPYKKGKNRPFLQGAYCSLSHSRAFFQCFCSFLQYLFKHKIGFNLILSLKRILNKAQGLNS